MSLDLPKWLDEKFFCKCLQDGKENKQISVTTFDVTTAVPPGNNYGSCLWRVNVEYNEKGLEGVHQLSLIVKAPLQDGPIKEMFENFLLTEPTFYKKFLPLSFNISLNNNFAPKMYFSNIPNVVVLEDLKAKGYLMADRCKMLDFDHSRLYATISATFHAASVAVHKEQPELVESLGKEKMFSNDIQSAVGLKKLVLNGVFHIADQMESVKEYQKYATYVRNSSAIWDMLVDIHKPNETLNALHQGDPWTTNMMFQYDHSGRVTDVKLLDFQALRYASPVNDLVFFIWTSASHDVREHRLKDLYRIYCDTLNTKLEEFNCPERLSYEQLQENLRILSPQALALAAAFYPFLTNPKPIDLDSVMSKDCDESKIQNVFREYYNNEYCKYTLPKILKQLESGGVFEYIKAHCQPR